MAINTTIGTVDRSRTIGYNQPIANRPNVVLQLEYRTSSIDAKGCLPRFDTGVIVYATGARVKFRESEQKRTRMTPYELFDLMISTSNRTDIQWGLFITVHMALFGGIIYVDRPLTRSEKVGAMIIYAGFALINYLVTRDLIEFHNSTNQEIARYATDACCRDNILVKKVVAHLDGPGYEISQNVLLWSHLFMSVLVTLSVIFDKKVAALSRPKSVADENS